MDKQAKVRAHRVRLVKLVKKTTVIGILEVVKYVRVVRVGGIATKLVTGKSAKVARMSAHAVGIGKNLMPTRTPV